MKKASFILILCLLFSSLTIVVAQTTPATSTNNHNQPGNNTASRFEGLVTYERTMQWSKLQQRATYLSQEQKDRMQQTGKNWGGYKILMNLYFSPSRSLYTYTNDRAESEDGRYTWRPDTYLVARDFKNSTATEQHEMIDNLYLLTDSLRPPKWRIMNEIKDINGYVCMKAVLDDSIRNQKVTAWFTDAIPVSAGPERYFGLPGLILEVMVNDGDVLITAQSINFQNVSSQLKLPKKLKGKKVNEAQFNQLITNYIAESASMRRFPSAIRY